MQRQKRNDLLQFLAIAVVTAVIGVAVIYGLRDDVPEDPVVTDEESGQVATETSSISSEWCDEFEEGDCLPATCQANAHTIVVFHADWCPWCRKLKKETLSDHDVAKALKPFGKVSVDTETNPETSAAHEVSGIPAVIVLDGSCKEVLRLPGFVDAERLLEELRGL